LVDWVLYSGLTQEEAALIQPAYSTPAAESTLAVLEQGASLEQSGVRYENFQFTTYKSVLPGEVDEYGDHSEDNQIFYARLRSILSGSDAMFNSNFFKSEFNFDNWTEASLIGASANFGEFMPGVGIMKNSLRLGSHGTETSYSPSIAAIASGLELVTFSFDAVAVNPGQLIGKVGLINTEFAAGSSSTGPSSRDSAMGRILQRC
jgi:hypothetical protein